MIRKFWLVNENDDEISFNECDIFGYNPSDIGLSFQNDFIEYQANFINIEQVVNQNQFSLDLLIDVLKKQSYVRYFDFVNNFLNYQNYTLKYETDAGLFQRKAILQRITKTERTLENGLLNEQLVLDFLTPWYIEITNTKNLTDNTEIDDQNDTSIGKIYLVNSGNTNTGYVYSYIYGAEESPGGTGTSFYRIANNSKVFNYDISSPVEIKITATSDIVNPSWDLYSGSEIIQSDGFNMTLQSGHSIIVSSFPENQQAIMIDQSGNETPIYQYQDFTKTNFIEIPSGNTTLIFNFDNADIQYTIRQQYLVV